MQKKIDYFGIQDTRNCTSLASGHTTGLAEDRHLKIEYGQRDAVDQMETSLPGKAIAGEREPGARFVTQNLK